MAKKIKCTFCKNYYQPPLNYLKKINNYCSAECVMETYKKRNTTEKKAKKSKYKNSDGEHNLRWYKDKTWDEFSIYIRTRDCLRFKGRPDQGTCVTCKKDYSFKNLQAGHFIGGRGNSVLYDETCVYTQCYGCNMGKNGAYVEYFIFMEQEWGRKYIEVLRAKKTQTIKYSKSDLLKLKQVFINKTQQILKEYENKTIKQHDLHPMYQSKRGY